jgi:hypothetical protein
MFTLRLRKSTFLPNINPLQNNIRKYSLYTLRHRQQGLTLTAGVYCYSTNINHYNCTQELWITVYKTSSAHLNLVLFFLISVCLKLNQPLHKQDHLQHTSIQITNRCYPTYWLFFLAQTIKGKRCHTCASAQCYKGTQRICTKRYNPHAHVITRQKAHTSI